MNSTTGSSIFWAISDTFTMTRRGLLKYIRIPQLLVFSTIQPVMFMLLFAYVFGGAIATPQGNYLDFLVPGILVQTIIFGSTATGVGLSQDLASGMTDRFHSLPMSRSALLAGRIISDTVRNLFVLLLMVVVGTFLGFRFQDGWFHAVAALVLILSTGVAFSWISATIGLAVKDSETVQVAGTIWIFPLVFASSIFVPVKTMPDFLQVLAEHSPITYTVNTVRALMIGGDISASLGPSLIWLVALSTVFSILAVRIYQRRT